MTKIKLCGLRRIEDIENANSLMPDYIGFVFAPKSKRFISAETAAVLKSKLDKRIKAVGVFVDEDVNRVAEFLKKGIIDLAQLHGLEDEEYLGNLRKLSGKPIIKAFKIKSGNNLQKAEKSSADYILLDAGAGDGITFDWSLLKGFKRPYFLAGGLDPQNVRAVVERFHPFGVDVSSGIETDGFKDPVKMIEFVNNTRGQYT